MWNSSQIFGTKAAGPCHKRISGKIKIFIGEVKAQEYNVEKIELLHRDIMWRK